MTTQALMNMPPYRDGTSQSQNLNKSSAEASKIVSIPQSASAMPRISMNPLKENEINHSKT